MNEWTGPSNYICKCECHTDPEAKHEGHCCFKCSKCDEMVVVHLYNEHRASCSRRIKIAKQMAAKRRRAQPVNPDRPEQEEVIVPVRTSPSFGSTRSRHRKRRPIRK